MRFYIIRSLAILFLLVGYASANVFGQETVLGILEDNPGHYLGEANDRTVRVVFKKTGGDWEAFRSECGNQDCLKTIAADFPDHMTWTIGFDGKMLGTVATRAQEKFEWYSSIGQENIASNGPVPTIGQRLEEFGGWAGRPVYRPLVANSLPYFKDPESWKRTEPSAAVLGLLRGQFRNKFPQVTNCDNPDENRAKPWSYRDEDIKIFRAYSARSGWLVVSLHLDENRCDGPWEGPADPFSTQWFALSPNREVSFLDQGMWLVDAGDYDNDGKSELVFTIGRYDRGGYEIFYDDFKKHASFEYSYH